jgi:hypothetical protein
MPSAGQDRSVKLSSTLVIGAALAIFMGGCAGMVGLPVWVPVLAAVVLSCVMFVPVVLALSESNRGEAVESES